MKIKLRRWHGYIGLLAALPLIVMTLTGLMLQLRNQFEWIQPKTEKFLLTDGEALLSMEEVVKKFEGEKVEQVIYRPGKANYSVRLEGGMEVQLHPQTGEIKKSLPRRSGFLIDLHQGSWLGPLGQYLLHFAAGVGLFFLIISGIIIYPFKKWRKI